MANPDQDPGQKTEQWEKIWDNDKRKYLWGVRAEKQTKLNKTYQQHSLKFTIHTLTM